MPLIRITKRIITMLLAIGVALPIPAFAQSAPQDLGPEGSVWLNPSFQVGNITVQNKQDAITGTVDVLNDTDASFGNIRLQLLLMEPAPVIKEQNTFVPDNARVIDRVILPTTETFSPQEKKNIAFTYTPPKLPTGDYRIRLQVITSNGNAYGWDDYALKMGTEGASFVLLSPGPLTVKGEAHNPIEGPNIEPGSTVTVSASTKLVGAPSLTVTPVLTTYAFDLTGKVIATQKEKPVTLTSAKETEHTFSVKVSDTPGAYQTTLTFVDASGKIVSSMEQYRWVVSGVTARVISGRFLLLEEKNAEVQFEIAGPADGVASVDTGIKVFLLDADKVLQDESTTIDKLGENGLQSGKATFAIDAMPKDPGFRIVLTDTKTNAVLDTYEAHVKAVKTAGKHSTDSSPAPKRIDEEASSKKLVVLLAVIFVALVASVAGWAFHKKGAGRMGILAGGIGIIGAGILLAGAHFTRASGIQITTTGTDASQKYYINATLNQPIHDNDAVASPVDKASIPVQFILTYGRCNNYVVTPSVATYYLRSGEKAALAGSLVAQQVAGVWDYSSYDISISSPASVSWTSFTDHSTATVNGSFDKLLYASFANTACSGSTNCTASNNLTGVLTLPSTYPYESTTLLWLFRADYRDSSHGDKPFRLLQAMYTWVNFREQAPVCGTTPSLTPATCSSSTIISGIKTIGPAEGGVVDFVNSFGMYTYINSTPSYAASLVASSPTKEKLCQMAGYSRVASTNESTYRSPRNNQVVKWDPVSGNFVATNANTAGNPAHLRSITCDTPIPQVCPASGSATPTPSACPTVPPVAGNQPAVADVKMSIDNGVTYTANITVTKGVPVPLRMTARDSFDPDGWDTPGTGVSQGGACEWDRDLNYSTLEYKINNPASSSACDINLGMFTFDIPAGVYPYDILQITDASGAKSNIGRAMVTVVNPTVVTPTPVTPTPLTNRAPTSVAKIKFSNSSAPYSSAITVTQGSRVSFNLSAIGSDDPDGWTTPAIGVSDGGTCEWNTNIISGTFNTSINSPVSPDACSNVTTPLIQFNALGTNTYNLLRITDGAGAQSANGTVQITVVAPTVSASPSPGSGLGGFEEVR